MDILSDVKISGDLTVKDATLSRNGTYSALRVDKSFESNGTIIANNFCINGKLDIDKNGITTYTNSDFVLKSTYGNFGFGINSVGKPFLMNGMSTEYLGVSRFSEILPSGCTRFVIAGPDCPNQYAPTLILNAPLVSIFGCVDGKMKRVEIDYEIEDGNCFGVNLIGQLSTALDCSMHLDISIA